MANEITMWDNETRVVPVQATGALTGKALRFVIQDTNTPPNYAFKVEDADIDLDAEDATVALVEVSPPSANRDWRWLLWNVDDDLVMGEGAFVVREAHKDAPA